MAFKLFCIKSKAKSFLLYPFSMSFGIEFWISIKLLHWNHFEWRTTYEVSYDTWLEQFMFIDNMFPITSSNCQSDED